MGEDHGLRRAAAEPQNQYAAKQGHSAAYHPGDIMQRRLFKVLGRGLQTQGRPQHGPAAA
eukprot:7965656-Prorocentrum_lima.AAC.1